MTATEQRRTLIWDNDLDVDARAKLHLVQPRTEVTP